MLNRFTDATPARQLQMAVAGVAILALVLCAVWYAAFRTVYQPLFSQLRVGDAASIVAELNRKKIPYRLADGGTTILVPTDMSDSVRLDVMSDNIPLKGGVGFELFNKSDMGLTDFAQKINYQRALQGELARTIMTLDGVNSARVHLSLGEDRIFRDDQVPPKASVTIRMSKDAVLSEAVALGMKRLVAAAVPKLDANNVVILDELGQVVNSTAPVPATPETPSPALEARHAIEQYYESRIRAALMAVRPAEHFTIGVRAGASAAGQVSPQEDLAFSAWRPEARQFPLHVNVAPALPLGGAGETTVRAVVISTIGSIEGMGDTILFGPPPPQVMAEPPAAPRLAPRAMTPLPRDADVEVLPQWMLFAAPALVILIVAIFLIRKSRGPRRLSARDHEAFAARLRVALDERGANAARS